MKSLGCPPGLPSPISVGAHSENLGYTSSLFGAFSTTHEKSRHSGRAPYGPFHWQPSTFKKPRLTAEPHIDQFTGNHTSLDCPTFSPRRHDHGDTQIPPGFGDTENFDASQPGPRVHSISSLTHPTSKVFFFPRSKPRLHC